MIYTDTIERDISSWVKTVNITRSILEPYESARLDLNVPYEVEVFPTIAQTGAFDLDAWIVIYNHARGDTRERAVFLGCVSSITSGYYAVTNAALDGGIKARDLSLRCESWLKVARSGEVYLSSSASSLAGHILDIESLGERFRRLGSLPFQSNNIGSVLNNFWAEFSASYRLPDMLGGQSLADVAKIAFDDATALTHAPLRLEPHRGVFGLALNAVRGAIAGGGATAWGILRSVFGAEPNMIELFTSLEPTDENEGRIEEKLGVRPVIIYRMKPFIFGDYSQATSDAGLRLVDNTAGASSIALVIEANEIISIDLSQSDKDRINGVYLNTPLTPSRGVEVFGLAGTPVFNENDIDRQGLRLFLGQWPFFPQGKKRGASAESYRDEIQEVIDLAAAITEEDHRFFNGTVEVRGRFAFQAGMWVRFNLATINKRSLVVYVETVSFNLYVREDGVLVQRASLEFTRGFYD